MREACGYHTKRQFDACEAQGRETAIAANAHARRLGVAIAVIILLHLFILLILTHHGKVTHGAVDTANRSALGDKELRHGSAGVAHAKSNTYSTANLHQGENSSANLLHLHYAMHYAAVLYALISFLIQSWLRVLNAFSNLSYAAASCKLAW